MYLSVKLCFVVLAVLLLEASASPSRLRRQGFSWGDEEDFDFTVNRRPTPTPTTAQTSADGGTTTTTASPEFTSCMRRCPVTPQYNPVCGSNRVTYNNDNHLNCARSCGLQIRKEFGGTCAGL